MLSIKGNRCLSPNEKQIISEYQYKKLAENRPAAQFYYHDTIMLYHDTHYVRNQKFVYYRTGAYFDGEIFSSDMENVSFLTAPTTLMEQWSNEIKGFLSEDMQTRCITCGFYFTPNKLGVGFRMQFGNW